MMLFSWQSAAALMARKAKVVVARRERRDILGIFWCKVKLVNRKSKRCLGFEMRKRLFCLRWFDVLKI